MASGTSTQQRILRFISTELLDGRDDSVDPLADGLLDSLAIEQLITFVEERYEFQFDDEELVVENFASIENLAALVDKKRGADTS